MTWWELTSWKVDLMGVDFMRGHWNFTFLKNHSHHRKSIKPAHKILGYNSTMPLPITNSYYTLSYAWFSMQCVKWNTYYYTIWFKKKHTKSQNWEILGVSTCSSVGTWLRKIQYIPAPVYSSTSHFTLWIYIDDSNRSEDQQYDGSCSHDSLLKFDKQVIHNWNMVRASLSCCYCSQSLSCIVHNASISFNLTNRSNRRNKIASFLLRHAKTLIENLDAFMVALHSFAGYI